jgi:hypothetical protein
MGCERLIEAVMDRGVKLRNKDKTHLYIIQLGEDATKAGTPAQYRSSRRQDSMLTHLSRYSIDQSPDEKGKPPRRKVCRDHRHHGSQKWHLPAQKYGAWYAERVPTGRAVAEVVKEVDPKELDFYSPQKDFVIEVPSPVL